MKKSALILACSLLCGIMAGAADQPDAAALRGQALKVIGTLPNKIPGSEKDTALQVDLGKKLYFDTRLSLDNTVSCNTCHLVDKGQGGSDGKPVSDGVGGKKGNRNSPTVWNSCFNDVQFWDGRAPDLTEQAKGPILNPVEMAMPNEKAVVEKLSKDTEYPAEFKAAFPNEADALTFDNIARAIAAYERTLVTQDRFDDFLKGDDKALNARELAGLNAFLKKGCTSCHKGPGLGGKGFYKMGLHRPYPNKEDLGRFDVTGKNADKLKFRVPNLRNIEVTAPYFHDGKVATLEDAVDMMGDIQIKKNLTEQEKADIVSFLKTLTGKELSK